MYRRGVRFAHEQVVPPVQHQAVQEQLSNREGDVQLRRGLVVEREGGSREGDSLHVWDENRPRQSDTASWT